MGFQANIQQTFYPIALLVAFGVGLLSAVVAAGGLSGILKTRKLTTLQCLSLITISVFFTFGAYQLRMLSPLLFITGLSGLVSGANKSAGTIFRLFAVMSFFAATGMAGIMGFINMAVEIPDSACRSYFDVQDPDSAICKGYLDFLHILGSVVPGLLAWVTADALLTDS